MTRHFILALCAAWLVLASPVFAAPPDFPPLTGRVVDRADLLDDGQESQLDGKLAAHEQQTGQQLVVVTVPTTGDTVIEDYGYQLGRHWGIGHKGKDNGALLIVARDDRRVRIETGYGLEGTLTDAASSLIITRVILPAFRQGDYAGGVLRGTDAMLGVLRGDPDAMPLAKNDASEQPSLLRILLILFILYLVMRRNPLLGPLVFSTMSRGGFGGGLGGGGFGGGGGGFGGGGASGRW